MKRQQHTLREDKRPETGESPGRACLRSRLGFTLVELMIVGVLLVILGGAFVTTFLSGQTSYFAADANIQIQQEARRAFDFMTHELRQSGTTGGTVLSCNLNTTDGCSTPPGGTPTTQINFQIAKAYTAGAITWGSDRSNPGDYIHYKLLAVGGTSTEYKLIRFLSGTINDSGPATVAACTAAVPCRILANYISLGSGTTQSGFLLSGTGPSPVVTIQLQLQYRSPLRPTQTMGSSTAPLVAQVELRNP